MGFTHVLNSPKQYFNLAKKLILGDNIYYLENNETAENKAVKNISKVEYKYYHFLKELANS